MKNRRGTTDSVGQKQPVDSESPLTSDIYRRLFDNCGMGVVVLDPDHRFVEANLASCRMLGRTIDELRELTVSEVIYTDDLELFQDMLRNTCSTEGDSPKTEIRLVRKSGEDLWASVYTSVMRNGEGDLECLVVHVEDISDQKRAAADLKLREERYEELVENVNDVIYSIDENGIVTFISRAVERVYGYTPYEIQGRQFVEFLHSEDLPEVIESFAQYARGIDQSPDEYRVIAKSGAVRWCSDDSRANIVDGKFKGVRGVLRDITERKHAEEGLRSAEEKYRQLVERISEVVYEADSEGFVTSMWASDDTAFGYSLADAQGMHFSEFAHPDDLPKAEEYHRAIAAGEEVRPLECRIITKSGEIQWANVASSRRFKDGVYQGSGGMVRDITDRKSAELELAASERKFKDLVEQAGIAIVIDDEDGNFSYCNERFAMLFGYTPDEIREQSISRLVHPDDLETVLKRHRNRYAGIDVETRYEFAGIKKNGSTIYLELYAFALMEGDTVVGTRSYMWDVTDRRTAEIALWQSEERFHLAVRGSNDGLWDWPDMNSDKLWWAPRTFEILGYEAGEFQPTDSVFAEMFHPDDKERGRQMLRDHLRDRKIYDMEHRLRMKSGEYRWFLTRGQALWDSMGRPVRMAGSIRDITSVKQAEEALQESEAKYHQLFTTETDAIMLFDADTLKYIDVNDAAIRLYGYSKDEFMNLTVLDVSAEIEKTTRSVADICDKIVENIPIRYHKKKDGTVFPVEVSPGIFELGGRKVMCGIIRDITERLHSEHKLRESEAKFRELFSNMSIGVVICESVDDGNDFIFKDVNNACERIDSIKREDLIGNSVLEMFPGVKEFGLLDVFQRVWRTGNSEQHPASFYKDGRITGWRENYVYKLSSGEVISIYEDVTERKNAEHALRASEEKYRHLYESISDGAFVLDEEWRFVMANEVSARQLSGMSSEDLIGCKITDIIPHVASTLLFKVCKKVMDTRTHETVIDQLIDSDNIERWLEIRVYPTDVGIHCLSKDITERMDANRQIRKAKEQYESLMENIPDAIYSTEVGGQGHTTFASKRLEEWTGCTLEDFGKDPDLWSKSLHPDDREEIQMRFHEAVIDRREFVLEYRIINLKTQEMRYVMDHGIPHFDFSGNLVRFDGIITDISVRKRAEENLRQSRRFTDNLISTANAMIVALDAEGKVTLLNPAAERITGYSVAELEGKDWFEIIVPRERYPDVYEEFCRLGAGGLPRTYENPILSKDGLERIIAWSNNEVFRSGRIVGSISFGIDITAQKKAEWEIKKLNEELEQRVALRTSELAAANRELDSFAHSVAHDLRAPLRAIDGFSHALKSDYEEKLGNEGKRLLNIVSSNAQGMGRLIDALLTFSRYSRQVIDATPIDMEALTKEVFEHLRSEASGRNIQFKVGALPKASGDRTLIREVMGNLLSNAIKFSSTMMVSKIEVKAESAEGEVIYSVHDNGVGFDMKYVDKLFQVFQRLHSVEEFEGSGIGLANVKRIVVRHGGRVWAEGKPGKGTTVYFTLIKG